ncbi:hypothetical protein ACSX1A_01050 [Pontibacter sp. MBLB2868]|uniref:hypothetical protein n=1 Tax=Pontibacter sp. MBLB2868 TaxID=3451555 RepID=UPI003F74E207
MLGALILLVVLYLVNQPILRRFKKAHPYLSVSLMNKLYFFHVLFWLIYYLYATFNASDSKAYYERTTEGDDSWLGIYQTGTKFIDFVAYPFTHSLGFSYEASMLLFAWFGYLGFLYFYLFFKENIKTKLKLWNIEIITLLIFLPNMHFWTASLGKGSLIFLGIGMFTYAMRIPQKRILTLLAGALIVFNIRPHMFLFLGFGAVLGYFTGKEKVPMYQKILVYVAFIGAIALFYDQILAVANINEQEVFSSFDEFATNRAASLSESGSGVDMNSYPLPLKLFTFWYRPLFIDAPGALGLYISLENLFYLFLTLKLWDKDFFKFLKTSTSLVKMSLVIFLTSSVALSFVMSNLGIATRQKSMVMYFLFFVIISFLDFKKRKLLFKRQKLIEQQQALSMQQQ